MDTICWPNPLLGQCKEADISEAELNDLLTGGGGAEIDLDLCSCASEGFGIANKVEDNIQTYSPSPRVTLCYFNGNVCDGAGWWETDEGGRVEKKEICKQVTVDYGMYHLRTGGESKKSFNAQGIFECKNGCASLGYTVPKGSSQHLTVGNSKQKQFRLVPSGGRGPWKRR